MPHPDGPLLAGLVDDAALFPPGNATMTDALRDHEGLRDEPWSDAVGSFVCPASRVDELLSSLGPQQAVLVSLVLDPTAPGMYDAVRRADAAPRVAVVGVEAPLEKLGADGARVLGADLVGFREGGGPHVGFLEVPRSAPDDALDLVRSSGWHAAKYRTGGLTAPAHPGDAELARFLVGCAERALPFKLTAGLHHAARTTTPDGFEQHGVLNVLSAVSATVDGRSRDEVADLLAERDGAVLAKDIRSWTPEEARVVRSRFLSFGCCGVTEPLDELRALGVLDDEESS